MKPGRLPSERELPGLLDRLVCGELDELPRGRLLEWLDEDPLRWRACGLAFLEAQTWSQALGQWPLRELGSGVPLDQARSETSRRPISCDGATGKTQSVPVELAPSRQRRMAIRRTVIAAAVVVAFGMGLTLRDVVTPSIPTREQPVAGAASSGADGGNAGRQNHDAARTEEPL